MTKLPISVVVPAYNAERTIVSTLESVLMQTVSPTEIIVVDDGSQDGTRSIASKFPIKLLSQPNRGPAAARNAGMRAASQPWIALLDSDDTWSTDKLERQWSAHRLYPSSEMIICDLMQMDEKEGISSQTLFGSGQHEAVLSNQRMLNEEIGLVSLVESGIDPGLLSIAAMNLSSSVLFARKIFEQIGGFRTTWLEDFEFFLRAASVSSILVVNVPLVTYRIYESSRSGNVIAGLESFLEIEELVRSSPENYPPGTQHFFREAAPEKLIALAREHLRTGNVGIARKRAFQSLTFQWSHYAAMLWVSSWLPAGLINSIVQKRREWLLRTAES